VKIFKSFDTTFTFLDGHDSSSKSPTQRVDMQFSMRSQAGEILPRKSPKGVAFLDEAKDASFNSLDLSSELVVQASINIWKVGTSALHVEDLTFGQSSSTSPSEL
jgi:hypothetical protein